MANGNTLDRVGLALQGFGAGVQGRGLEFAQQLDERRKMAMVQDALQVQGALESGDVSRARQLLVNRVENINRLGGDPSDTMGVLQKLASGDSDGALGDVRSVTEYAYQSGMLRRPESGMSLEEREFNNMLENSGLSDQEKQIARRVRLGLSPRAVGSAAQTIAQQGETEQVAGSQAVIEGAKEGAKTTARLETETELGGGAERAKEAGKDAAKTASEAFAQAGKIRQGLSIFDEAAAAIDAGATTGKVMSILPSVRDETLKLDNLKQQLGLQVIQSATFGALSEKELEMAQSTGLPTGLSGPALKDWIIAKKAAQQKLADYAEDYALHLEDGGTKGQWIKMQRALRDKKQDSSNAPAVIEVDF